jgi:hypothetical protein
MAYSLSASGFKHLVAIKAFFFQSTGFQAASAGTRSRPGHERSKRQLALAALKALRQFSSFIHS